MENEIFTWLNENEIDDAKGLRINDDFIAFLVSVFPHKTEDDLKHKVYQMGLAYGTDIKNFSSGLFKSLS